MFSFYCPFTTQKFSFLPPPYIPTDGHFIHHCLDYPGDHPPSFLTNVCKYTVFFTSPLREAFNEKTIMEIFQLFHSISQLGLLSSLATAISGRTWLLLVFRWLDSYCINLLIFSHFTHPKCIHIDSHTKLSHDRKKLVSLLQILLTSLTLTFNVSFTHFT